MQVKLTLHMTLNLLRIKHGKAITNFNNVL